MLGRAPDGYQETVYHSHILDNQGYDADIDSYVDSDEYKEQFGDDTVPFYRGYQTQTGKNLLGYTNMFEMLPSASSSDQSLLSGNMSRLRGQLMRNTPNGKAPVTDVQELLKEVLGLKY